MNSNKKHIIFGLICMHSVVSCKSESFSGDGGGRAEAKPKPKPAPIMAPDLPAERPVNSCTQARLLSVKSLKNFVDQNVANPTIDVELTFEPCVNQQSNLSLPLAFDLDADIDFSGNYSQSIRYELTPQGAQASQGSLRFVTGSDLFNKTGSNYGYFAASSPLQASPTISKAILKINIDSIKILGRVENDTPETSNFQMPLHVRVGDSTPVTGEITFTPAN